MRFTITLEGDIYFDDVDIKDISLKSLRESIGYVSSGPSLINGTIRENLLFNYKNVQTLNIKCSI